MLKRNVLLTLLAFSVLGVPAYFLAFLFSYGFQDSAGVEDHAEFLVLVAAFAVAVGAMSAAVAVKQLAPVRRAAVAFGVLASLSLNAAVVGLGSIVSAANKDVGSVSKDFSTTTDVLVAAVLLVCAASFAAAAWRADLERVSSTSG